jgi:hypothetical protein
MADQTVQSARDFVRLYLDTDTEELPDQLLDVFFDQALTRIDRASRRWRFYEAEFALATVASTQSHTFASIDATLQDVTTVQGQRWQLEPLSHEIAQRKYAFFIGEQEPMFWSTYADTLYLWPTPGDAYSLVVRGYRKMTRPADAGAAFDFPEDFHPLVLEYALARAYEQQDDDVMSQQKFLRFEQELAELKTRWETPPSGGTVLGAGTRRTPWHGQDLPSRLLYDFE